MTTGRLRSHHWQKRLVFQHLAISKSRELLIVPSFLVLYSRQYLKRITTPRLQDLKIIPRRIYME